MITLFVDTNLFVECSSTMALAWGDLADGQDLRLIVPREVQKELDQLKVRATTRVKKRAQKASSLLRKVIQANTPSLVLQEAEPRVTLELSFPSPRGPNDEPLSEELDLSEADHRMIDEVLRFKADHPEEFVLFLTNDTHALFTARQCRLETRLIPDEWLLPVEPDSRDKEIEKLRAELKLFRDQSPRLEITCINGHGEEINKLDPAVKTYPQLTEEQLLDLLSKLADEHPMVTVFGRSQIPGSPTAASIAMTALYSKPASFEIERYQGSKYPKWLEEVQTELASLAGRLELRSRLFPLTFSLKNEGLCPAENVIVTIKAHGGLNLVSQEEAAEIRGEPPTLPPPPEPPKPRSPGARLAQVLEDPVRSAGVAASVVPEFPLPPRHIDRYSFYPDESQDNQHSFTCQELRHRVDPKRVHLVLAVPKSVTSGAVTCSVTASNLPEPISISTPVNVAISEEDTWEAALRLITSISE